MNYPAVKLTGYLPNSNKNSVKHCFYFSRVFIVHRDNTLNVHYKDEIFYIAIQGRIQILP